MIRKLNIGLALAGMEGATAIKIRRAEKDEPKKDGSCITMFGTEGNWIDQVVNMFVPNANGPYNEKHLEMRCLKFLDNWEMPKNAKLSNRKLVFGLFCLLALLTCLCVLILSGLDLSGMHVPSYHYWFASKSNMHVSIRDMHVSFCDVSMSNGSSVGGFSTLLEFVGVFVIPLLLLVVIMLLRQGWAYWLIVVGVLGLFCIGLPLLIKLFLGSCIKTHTEKMKAFEPVRPENIFWSQIMLMGIRPWHTDDLAVAEGAYISKETQTDQKVKIGMPSNHCAISVFMFMLMISTETEFKGWQTFLFCGFFALVPASRFFNKDHTAFQCICGGIIGYASVWIAILLGIKEESSIDVAVVMRQIGCCACFPNWVTVGRIFIAGYIGFFVAMGMIFHRR